MKLGILFSGGKDSTFALYWAVQQKHSAECLITLEPENLESYMFHVPNIDFTKLQAKALNMGIIFEETKGEKEKELSDLKRAIKKAKKEFELEGIVAGALFSTYQKERVEKICKELGLKLFAPFWQCDPEQYLNEIISSGFDIIITAVAAEGLDESWLGRKIDKACLEDLKKLHKKYKIHIAFEGGEAETLVLDCPLFKKKIKIEEAEKQWHGLSGELVIKKAELVEK